MPTGAPPTSDAAMTVEKLDAALNNMSDGLCMFGPDNRLLLWNDRYVKMYKLAPDCLRVGCTLDEMLEARKAAGTAYRDLGQYGSKLQAAVDAQPRQPRRPVRRRPHRQLSYRPTQNDCDGFQAGAIIHAILRLGRTLALPVIAEGVETEEQRAFLAREGCQVQGYLIGRPEPIAHYRHLVAGLAGAREDIVGAR
jgi:PAS domain-containing protein